VFVGEWVSVGKGLFVGVCVVGDTLGEGVVRMGEGSVGLGVEVEAAAGGAGGDMPAVSGVDLLAAEGEGCGWIASIDELRELSDTGRTYF